MNMLKLLHDLLDLAAENATITYVLMSGDGCNGPDIDILGKSSLGTLRISATVFRDGEV